MLHKSSSPDETFELARALAKRLKKGDVLALIGELGAGKTRFVQGLAAGLGVPGNRYVRSPSFTLMNEYTGGRMPLYHFDFYRLKRASELYDLGLDEYFDGDGVTVIEWADRFPDAIPSKVIRVEFKITDENRREIRTHEPKFCTILQEYLARRQEIKIKICPYEMNRRVPLGRRPK